MNDKVILLANGRSGIAVLIELLSPAHVWMPSYLCRAMLQAADRTITKVKFYEVDYNLAIPSLEWLNDVKPDDLVVFIDYFGFPCAESGVKRAKEQSAWVLEDACQALLSEEIGRNADYILFSPSKFLGVPDGGILVYNHEIACDTLKLKNSPATWWLKVFTATLLRREFDRNGGSLNWFELFQEANAECPIGPYAMSELSQVLLRNGFDYSMIAHRRIENYEVLSGLLGNVAIFPTLTDKVVPLGFPIRVKGRDRVRQILFNHQIYPPVHWPIQEIVPNIFKDSHWLASEIMTLPCDQRYDAGDMERMAALVKEAL